MDIVHQRKQKEQERQGPRETKRDGKIHRMLQWNGEGQDHGAVVGGQGITARIPCFSDVKSSPRKGTLHFESWFQGLEL